MDPKERIRILHKRKLNEINKTKSGSMKLLFLFGSVPLALYIYTIIVFRKEKKVLLKQYEDDQNS